MNNTLKNLIAAENKGCPLALLNAANKQGCYPVYFKPSTKIKESETFEELIRISQYFWTCLGFTGFATPWHENNPFKTLGLQKASIRKMLKTMEDMDVRWQSYCVFSLLFTDYIFYERPALLFCQRNHWSMVRKFRKYAQSREALDDVAYFLLEFVNLQVKYKGRAHLLKKALVGVDESASWSSGNKPKILIGCNRILDRINQMRQHKVDYLDWLEAKFKNCMKVYPGSNISLGLIININALDPDLYALQREANDSWKQIRLFLGLSSECQFPDGCIPKGWQPASEDADDRKKIEIVRADGYYYYQDGTQRRGCWHYSTNKYLTIKCSPENFLEYKSLWTDPRFLSKRPTWEEYSLNALYPGIWDAEGKNVSDFKTIKDIKWRKV